VSKRGGNVILYKRGWVSGWGFCLAGTWPSLPVPVACWSSYWQFHDVVDASHASSGMVNSRLSPLVDVDGLTIVDVDGGKGRRNSRKR
jgi:hypothetical protein